MERFLILRTRERRRGRERDGGAGRERMDPKMSIDNAC